MITENFFCVAPLDGEPCNYPIGVRKDEAVYTDNDPDSPDYGAVISICPGCKRPFEHVAWDGVLDIDSMLAREPDAKRNLVFPR